MNYLNDIINKDDEQVSAYNENAIEDLNKHIKKIADDKGGDSFKIDDKTLKDSISEIDKEQAAMYNAEVEKMNQMMDELNNELKSLKNISTKLNNKK